MEGWRDDGLDGWRLGGAAKVKDKDSERHPEGSWGIQVESSGKRQAADEKIKTQKGTKR